jgi:hypothetical protein
MAETKTEAKVDNTQKTNEPIEISLKELFSVVWKGKYIIILFGLIGLVLAGVGGYAYDQTNLQMSTVIELQWNGISQGEYPDGTQFDYSNAIESYVIAAAVDELDLNLTTAAVRKATYITPIVPDDVKSLIMTALENGEQMTYYATDYEITMNISELGLNEDDARELLNQILAEYKDDFDRRYISQEIVLDYTGADYTVIDYVDIVDILDAQTNLVIDILSTKYEENPEFVSPTLSFGFNDILVRAELVEKIELAQIEAKTNAYLLTKDADYLITYYNYQIERKGFDLVELQSQEANVQLQLTNYQGSTQTILIPGMDLDNSITVDTAYNNLLDEFLRIQAEIAATQNQISYLELLVNRYEDPSTVVSPSVQAAEIDKVEDLLLSADAKLNSIVADSNVLLAEYTNYVTSNTIKPLMAPEVTSSVSVLMIAAVGLVAFSGVTTLVVLFKHDWN